MNGVANERVFTSEEQEKLRAEVRGIVVAEGRSLPELAKESGVAYGTLAAWQSGTYNGRNERVASDVSKWLEARRELTSTAATLPAAPSYFNTPTSEEIFAMFAYAQMAPDLTVLSGGAGIGKTTALLEYQRTRPNVWVVTGEPSLSKPHNFLLEIAEALGIVTKANGRLSKAIQQRLSGTQGLLIVDEAQHLTTPTLDQIRSLHDLAKIGIALVGNETVYSRLEGEGRKAQFAQLFSRVGMRITQARPKARDIDALIAAWAIEDAKATALLKVIARKPGALRGVTKTLRLAHMLAAGANAPGISEKFVRQAWSQLSSQTIEQAA